MKKTPQTGVFVPSGLPTPELEILLAKIQIEVDNGNSVTVLRCGAGKRLSCTSNLFGLSAVCAACKSRASRGLSSVVGKHEVFTISLRKRNEPILRNDLDGLRSKYDFKNFLYEGQDLGQAAYSSYISATRDLDMEGIGAAAVCRGLLVNAINTFHGVTEVVTDRKITKLVVYNGRQCNSRAALRAAQNLGVDVEVMEFSGVNYDCVYEYKNHLPQEIGNLFNYIIKVDEKRTVGKEKVAEKYFQGKRAGEALNDFKSYTKDQIKGALPNGFDHNNHNVVIFNSSEDEFAALGGEYDDTLYESQLSGIERLCEGLSGFDNLRLYLRIHPNLSGLGWGFATRLASLSSRYDNITVISARSSISSYALLDACDKVITFGSTMTMEAVYAGKPSILLGRSIYERFEGVYCPKSHKDALKLIANLKLEKQAADEINKIAVFWKLGGKTLPFFRGNRSSGFLFKEKKIRMGKRFSFLYAIGKSMERLILLIRMTVARWINEK